jgi:hypothetical protein
MPRTVPANERLVGATVPASDRSAPQVIPIEHPFCVKVQRVSPPQPRMSHVPAGWGHAESVLVSDESLESLIPDESMLPESALAAYRGGVGVRVLAGVGQA